MSQVPHSIQIEQNHRIGKTEPCFIIAELGQNHQGDVNIARAMINAAKLSGADCVKFQKSDLKAKFNKSALLRPYKNVNSWGDTYGEHKRHLEFTKEEFLNLQAYAKEMGILFTASAMDDMSLDFLNSINVPFIKIGSGDFCNKPLLKKAAKLHKPLVISSGMSNMDDVVYSYNIIKAEHNEFCLLHCVSSYPAPVNEINLNVIKKYIEVFPDITIGYSSHELGVDIAVASVMLGGKVVEKHFTLDKTWKGSDHVCSLLPSEFKEMVEKIRAYEVNKNCDLLSSPRVESALGCSEKTFQRSEMLCYEKLGKTIVAARDLKKGEILDSESICNKVADPKGVDANKYDMLIGKTLRRDVNEDESIFEGDFN